MEEANVGAAMGAIFAGEISGEFFIFSCVGVIVTCFTVSSSSVSVNRVRNKKINYFFRKFSKCSKLENIF